MKSNSWHETEILLAYTGPLDWVSLLGYFSSHEIVGTEKVIDNSYERVFEIDGGYGFMRVAHHEIESALVLKLWVQDKKIIPFVVERVRKMFDLDLDHAKMIAHLSAQGVFKEFIQKHPALRVAKGWDIFEVIVLTILGQVVSVKRAKELLKTLVETHGISVKHPTSKAPFILFPTPQEILSADLAYLGTTQARKKSLKTIAEQILDKTIDPNHDDVEVLKAKLMNIPGIGKWSAEYIALRGVGHADSFPDTDLALKRAIEHYPKFKLATASPWRSYAAIYFWKDYTTHPEKYKK